MIATSPKSSFFLGLGRQRPFRVMVIGQTGVGKTAMIVRFITKRFIGDYDPDAQKTYTFRYHFENEEICFQLMDGSGFSKKNEHLLEAELRRADAFILMYSVTDKCSFDDTNRLKFLITYAKRRKRMMGRDLTLKDSDLDAPVVLVGNKSDQDDDRMVTKAEGLKRHTDIFCDSFHEISIRESYEEVRNVFEDVCKCWQVSYKFSKLKRSSSDVQNGGFSVTSPDNGRFPFSNSFRRDKRSSQCNTPEWEFKKSDECLRPDDNKDLKTSEPFRCRASTDGTILARPMRRTPAPPPAICITYRPVRRMSISLRGSNSSIDFI